MTAPLTAKQRKKGLVLPLSEAEAQVLRAMLGRTSDRQTRTALAEDSNYPAAVRLLAAESLRGVSITGAIYERLNTACDRRELQR